MFSSVLLWGCLLLAHRSFVPEVVKGAKWQSGGGCSRDEHGGLVFINLPTHVPPVP